MENLEKKERVIAKIKESMNRDFSEEQMSIITHFGKPLNGIAGAGSGKTTVSIGKILYLILYKDVNPDEILSITFSNKASLEIKERYQVARDNINRSIGTPLFKTFHSFFLSILKGIPEYRNIKIESYTKYKYDLLKEVKSEGGKDNSDILEQYMRIRSVLINYNVSTNGLLKKKDKYLAEYFKFSLLNYETVINKYNKLKERDNAIDFDDMQALLIKYLNKKSTRANEIISTFRENFKHIILDEYQDISPIQYDILNILMDSKQINNLVTLGDDDQCIYSFRGSQSEYIINFLDAYKNARRKYINKNYRCKSEILNEVIPMISNNQIRVEKQLVPANEGGSVEYINTDSNSEFNRFKNMLLKDIKEADNLSKDVAVLVRFNKNRMILADKLAENGVPTDIVNSKYLLQNNSIYKVIFDVAIGIKSRNVYLIKKHITKLYKGLSEKDIQEYINSSRNLFEDILTNKTRLTESDVNYTREILSTEDAGEILKCSWMLVFDYFKFMCKKKIYNKKDVNSIINYIISLSYDIENNARFKWSSLLQAEEYKKSFLLDFIGNEKVLKIYTIHSVKGLEFNKVYISDLDSSIVSEDELREFNADIKKENANDAIFEINGVYSQNKIINAINNSENNIEEERRIFYVACTRAINSLVICYSGSEKFALLNELKTFKEKTTVETKKLPET